MLGVFRRLKSSIYKGFGSLSDDADVLTVSNLHSCNDPTIERDSENTIYLKPSIYANKNRVYRDFDTIDWLQDSIKNKVEALSDKVNIVGINPQVILKWMVNKTGGWIILLIVSILMGTISCFIAVSVDWLSDLKEGYCTTSWYLSKRDCCWMNTENTSYQEQCNLWKTWSDVLCIDRSSKPTVYFMINYTFYVLFAVTMALLSSVYVFILSPYACGCGITEVKTILSGFVIRGYLGMRTVLIKIIALILSVASGLNISDESAQIHISSAIFNLATRLFPNFNKNEAKRREIIGIGAAAGFASAFNAPISGLLFGLEEICYFFSSQTLLRTFVCSMVSVFVHVQLRTVAIGQNSRYVSQIKGEWGSLDFLPFIVISFACGCFGVLFTKIFYKWSDLRKTTRIGSYPVIEIVVLTLVTSLISFPIELSRSSNHDLFARLMSRCSVFQDSNLCDYYKNSLDDLKTSVSKFPFIPGKGVSNSIWQLAIMFLTKIPLLALTTSAKIPTGYFLPLLVIGACIGRFVGLATEIILFEYLSHIPIIETCLTEPTGCISSNLYALVGASAFFSGVTRMTITSVLLLIEVTNGSYYITLIMLGSTIGNYTCAAFGSESIFRSQIKLNNYPYLDKLLSAVSLKPFKSIKHILKKFNLRENRTIAVMYETGMTFHELKKIMSKDYFGYPILMQRGCKTFVGYAKRTSLLQKMKIIPSEILARDAEILVSFQPEDSEEDTRQIESTVYFDECVDNDMITVDWESSVDNLAYIFQSLGMRSVIVIKEGEFMDIITKKDFLEYLL